MFNIGKRSARKSHAATPSLNDQLQQQVYELVRERLQHAFGAGGNWSVDLRSGSNQHTFFAETFAERLAWDVAARVTPARSEITPAALIAATPAALIAATPGLFMAAAAASSPPTQALVGIPLLNAGAIEHSPELSQHQVFVTPALGSFGPPVRVQVVPIVTHKVVADAVPDAVPVPVDYVGPAEWSSYGPPTLASLVASTEPRPEISAADELVA